MDGIEQNLYEMIHAMSWKYEDKKSMKREGKILETYRVDLKSIINTTKTISVKASSSKEWHYPPKDFIKFNFDGPSKGNPRAMGIGGAFGDETRTILRVFVGSKGRDTNNAIELLALKKVFK
jgi:hypothetical protein